MIRNLKALGLALCAVFAFSCQRSLGVATCSGPGVDT